MRGELERFVASLAIPAERKTVVLAELLDHAASAAEAAVRDGRDPDDAARAAIGDLEVLRGSLERVEPAFRITRRHALVRAAIAGVLVAVLFDQLLPFIGGPVAAAIAIAIAAVLAPRGALDMLRAELRAPRIRATARVGRGVPIGPAITYAFTVMYVPIAVWIGLIAYRAFHGVTEVDAPISALAMMAAIWLVLIVESIRARREATA